MPAPIWRRLPTPLPARPQDPTPTGGFLLPIARRIPAAGAAPTFSETESSERKDGGPRRGSYPRKPGSTPGPVPAPFRPWQPAGTALFQPGTGVQVRYAKEPTWLTN